MNQYDKEPKQNKGRGRLQSDINSSTNLVEQGAKAK